MAERLAAVPEENIASSAAAHRPRGLYRDLIRTVSVSESQIRSTLFSNSQSCHNGSSYSSDSGASSSYLSNNSGSSSVSGFAAATIISDHKLSMIARQMFSDGYIQRMVQAFEVACPATALEYGGGPGRALKNWFFELDVDWVLQLGNEHGSRPHLHLQDKSASLLQDLVEKWIRALTVIVVSVTELVFAYHETPVVTRFGRASAAKMLVFLDIILPALKAENLQAMLDMYVCVSRASYYMFTPRTCSGAQSIFNEIGSLLSRERNRINKAISSAMEEMRMLMEDDDSWAIEIKRGGGEVHMNVQLMVDCIISIRKAQASTQNSAPSYNTVSLHDLIDETINYLKDLLVRKSELCSDPSLRYMSLLNNSYFVAQVSEPSGAISLWLWSRHHQGLKLTPESEKYMDSYLDVSWGHVLSSIPQSRFPGLLHRLKWNNTSSLAKFQSAFHKTYQAQKFWKVPDPQLRDALRRTIAERVISGYRYYLKEHTEEEKHVSRGSSSPEVLEEMLGELFEG